jgi:L-aspartate oxidase
VYGAYAGAGASREALAISDTFRAPPLENVRQPPPTEPLDVSDICNSLKSLMWRAAGVRRHREALEDALASIENWSSYVLARQFDDAAGWELQNMLMLAAIVIRAALARTESRGVHLRTDFPETDDANWSRHLSFRRCEPDLPSATSGST